MFNFFVVSASHDMDTAIAWHPRVGAISEPRHYKQKEIKMKGIPKK